MNKHIKPCGICGENCSHLGSRGKTVVCPKCEANATTWDGRPLVIRDEFENENGVTYMMGPGAYFAEPDPQAGEEYTDIWEKGIWIEGRQVELFEGMAGWVGLIVR